MRRAAYIRALEEAAKLPDEIPELKRYFEKGYSPRLNAIHHLKVMAGSDRLLFTHEQADILNWKETNAESNDDSSSVSETQGQEDRERT